MRDKGIRHFFAEISGGWIWDVSIYEDSWIWKATCSKYSFMATRCSLVSSRSSCFEWAISRDL